MTWLKRSVAALSAVVLAASAGAAQAGELEIAYWGDGTLQWLQVDGRSYTVEYDSVEIKDIYEGAHTITYGNASTSRTIYVTLSSGNSAGTGYWCMALELDEYELLDDYDCDDMWDYYYFY